MEHREAKRQKVARRYMAGELSTVEREDFESHSFECAVCAGDVRTIVMGGPPASASVGGHSLWGWLRAFWQWRPTSAQLLAPACVALVFLSYQTLRMRDRLAPQSVKTYQLAPESRAAESTIDGAAGLVVLTADAPEMASEVMWQIRAADGGSTLLKGVASTQPGRALNLLIPVDRFTPGTYLLMLQDAGMMAPETAYRFRMH